MDIIKFPLKKRASKQADPTKALLRGPMQFTCPHCETTGTWVFEGITFRSVEFYCGGPSCGKYFKVTNPAFAQPK